MGGGGGGTTTQRSEPWSGQQPYLQDIYRRAQSQSLRTPTYYPGSTVAGYSPETIQALGAMQQRALGGAPYEGALQDFLTGMVSQPGVDIGSAVSGANTLIGGLGGAQSTLGQFAANPYSALTMPGGQQFANILGAGYGGLDAAQQFAGMPNTSMLDASSAYVQNQMANPTSSLDMNPGAANTLAQIQNFGGLGGAMDFAGSVIPGALDSSVNYVNNLLGSQGSLLPSAATDQLSQTASGEFLGSNPYLDDVFNTAAQRVTEQFQNAVMPGINATFGSAGRTGSGLHGQTVGQAAGELGQNLSGLAANIYAPAYEAERSRQMQAAGQLGTLGLGEGQQRLQAASLGGDLFSQQNAADLARRGLASNMFLGQQGQALQAAGLGLGAADAALGRQLGAAGLGGDLFSALNSAELGRLGLASNMYLGERGLAQQGAMAGLGFLDSGLDRSLSAANSLGSLGLGGINALGGLYGTQLSGQLGAAGMIPGLQDMDYRNIGAALGVGSAIDQMNQAQLDDLVARHNFQQQAPWSTLQNYANLIYGSPSFGTTTTSENVRGNPLAGALGGAMSGFSMFGPWGALGGGVLGLLGGL